MIPLLALLAALQAVPEPATRPEAPQCDLKNPDRVPCTVLEPFLYMPAMVLRLPELTDLGGESIRVTMIPSLGGQGEVYQLTLDPRGRASLLAVWVYGHGYSGWREIGREEAVLTPREYRRLARQVDEALARPDPVTEEICLDGAGMMTERYRNGRSEHYQAWGCGGEGSNIAFGLVSTFACRQIGRDASLAMIRSSCSSRLRWAREDH